MALRGAASPPCDFECPILIELMNEPVICVGDGFTYEKSAIIAWLRIHNTSPKTNQILSSKGLLPNRTLHAAIRTWEDENMDEEEREGRRRAREAARERESESELAQTPVTVFITPIMTNNSPANTLIINQNRTIRIAVGEAHEPHRLMMNHRSHSQAEWNSGRSMSIAGWTHKMEFWAYPTEQPGTICIVVGEAHRPHRLMMNIGYESDAVRSMIRAGWTHKMKFWVFPSAQPGTIRIAVGEAHEPHRMMINHGSHSQAEWNSHRSMSLAGWEHKMQFWAFPTANGH